MKIANILLTALLVILLLACGGGGAAGTSATPATYSIGQMQSFGTQPSSPQVNESLSAWLIGHIYTPDNEEIYLSTRTIPFSEGGSDRWAITVRVDPQLIPGIVAGSDLNVRLFSNYRNDCCLNAADAYGSLETYEHAYAAVGGSVTLNSDRQAIFDLQMQEESPARSGNFVGPTFQFKGCWQIVGEHASPSACIVP
jgi:hypothetical protein